MLDTTTGSRLDDTAEFAMRWSPSQGGPATGAAVLGLLNVQHHSSGPDLYDVQYFSVTTPGDAPKGFTVLLRERVKAAKPETTWKYRGAKRFPAQPLKKWNCPLLGADKSKDEMDVSLLAGGSVRRAYSRSCSVKGPISSVVPSALVPKAIGCAARMTRLEAGDLRVEEWTLSGRRVVLEVSMKGNDTASDLAAFKKDVARKILQAGAKPLDRSKSELGTQCN